MTLFYQQMLIFQSPHTSTTSSSSSCLHTLSIQESSETESQGIWKLICLRVIYSH
jgi:hypothetical protein